MQDNKAAYIAGRYGGSRPSTKQTRGSDPSETQKNEQEQQSVQASFDAGQQERQREQRATITKEKGVGAEGGLTPEELQQARNIASGKGDIDTFKDPYDVLTRQQEITAGYPKTALEKLREASGVKLLNPTLQLMGIGAKALQGLLDKTFKPQVSDFSNPNFLAVLDAAFKSGRLDKEKYTEKYKDLLDDVYGDQSKDPEMQTKLLEEGIGSLDSESLFNLAMEQATEGVLPGSGTQRITNPEAFYEDFTPQTSGDLANLAGLDVSSNPALADRIFAARMELDRMGKDMFGNTQGNANQGGGGGTYVPPTTTPDDPIIPQDPTLPPGVTPPTTTPKYPGSVVTDYTQLGLPQIYGNSQMPNYATFNRAGSMPVGLQDYLDNLRKRFGIG